MPKLDFIHLHVHSQFSLLEGALPLGKVLELTVADNQPALGIADTANLFGALEIAVKAVGKGVQPITGCELNIDFAEEEERQKERSFAKGNLVFIAMNEEGFLNLSRLITRAYMDGEDGGVSVHVTWLTPESTAGLICLSGGPEGAIDPFFVNGQEPNAVHRLDFLKQLFGDRFYIEIQRHGRPHEVAAESYLVSYAYEHDLPLVATNEPFFPTTKDYEAHDALLAIAGGTVLAQTERRKLTDQHYFKTQAEMVELFSDLPEAIANTVEIAQRVSFCPQERAPILPAFAAAPGLSKDEADHAEGEELARQARIGLANRIAAGGVSAGETEESYAERLEFELDVIRGMKFPGYFLIVADFIKWAKEQDIPVGPGRGSGAGSLVAYSLTITDIDPLRYNLLFERFLNPERVSMPDFDIDFCQDRREEVIHYVQDKYGREQVAQIITFGTLQARAALRDVGRVLQMPYGQVDRISKLVPSNPANPISLSEAIKLEPQIRALRDEDETVAELLTISQNLEGLYRHASTHAAGIVIGDRPLQELLPVYRDPRSEMPVTQYSQKWVENAGLVKFDFLGLKTLTVIDYAVKMIRDKGVTDFSIETISLEDKKTFELYQKGETVGVFQVESPGMRRALVDLLPDRFEDIIALVALYRPGPMDNIPSFCARKHGREEFSVLNERMEPILAETYGIIIYQEQVMQIAQVLSGYSLGEADMLRRAMGKKIKAEMDAQKSRFVDGAVKEEIPKGKADQIFELLAKFANYGFNKSHAAAYALVSYQTGFLKAHHPHEFIAASMTLDMGNTDKLNDFKREADRLKIEVKAPCINKSHVAFSVQDQAIVYSLCAVKGVGQNVAEHIVEVRGDTPFSSFADFASRIDPKEVNRRTMDTLVNAGAFDCLEEKRERVSGVIEAILGTAQRSASNRKDGISDMFSTDEPEPINLPDHYVTWTSAERLEKEFAAIGFHLSGHPLDEHQQLLERSGVEKWMEFQSAVMAGHKKAGKLAGTVVSRQDRRTKKGSPMAILALSDPSGSFECVVFSEQLTVSGEYLEAGAAVVLDVEAEQRAEGVGLRLIRAKPVGEVADRLSQAMTIFVGGEGGMISLKEQLQRGGRGVVYVHVIRDNGAREYQMELPGHYRLTSELAAALKAADGIDHVELA